jgi:hypothetical protein
MSPTCRLMRIVRVTALLQVTVLLAAASSSAASGQTVQQGIGTISERSTGITVTVEPGGRYAIAASDPGWVFAGDIGVPLTDISVNHGSDNIGEFEEIAFSYTLGTFSPWAPGTWAPGTAAARRASIRTYQDTPVLLFGATFVDEASNVAPFPNFTTYPLGLFHLAYSGIFGTYTFNQLAPDSPWLFFDSDANTFLLSPASDFMIASTTLGTDQAIASGIDSRIATLPRGFSQQTLLVVGHGIGRTFDTWGHALTDLQGKSRPANDADLSLNYLGYWTDNGATYYYNFEPDLGYEGTLLAVRDEFAQAGLTLGYLQLDSWFYPKGGSADWRDRSGGIYEYVADAMLFADGLTAFQQQLGLPLLTHARWIDPQSPYRQQYEISGNVSIDPLYWDAIAGYLQNAGVVTYEQDWLGAQAQTAFNLHDPNAFMDEMARAMSQNGLTMQYCMALPRHYLQTSRYDNITTIRASNDRFGRNRWNEFLYASRLAGALGVWPWSDVFMSSETDNLLVSTLSAGPVGVGDRIGSLNTANLLHAVRGDGVIVKPDAPLAPIDQTIINDAGGLGTPMIAATYTDFDASRALYIFGYNRTTDAPATFTPASLGLSGPVFIYNYFNHSGTVADGGAAFSEPIVNGHAYYIVVPIGPSGIGFLGDAGQFVSLGKKRIASVRDDGALEATVIFGNGEASRTLHGYSPVQPVIAAADGTVDAVAYDPDTQLFTVQIEPGNDGLAVVDITGTGGGAERPRHAPW